MPRSISIAVCSVCAMDEWKRHFFSKVENLMGILPDFLEDANRLICCL